MFVKEFHILNNGIISSKCIKLYSKCYCMYSPKNMFLNVSNIFFYCVYGNRLPANWGRWPEVVRRNRWLRRRWWLGQRRWRWFLTTTAVVPGRQWWFAMAMMVAAGLMVCGSGGDDDDAGSWRRQRWLWVGSGDVYPLTWLPVILKHNNNKKNVWYIQKNVF